MGSFSILLAGQENSDEGEEAALPSLHSRPSQSLSEVELQSLVVRAQDGDTEAFGGVYDHFFLPIYRYASFRVPAEMVEDVVADVFVKAWEKLHQYKARKGVPFAAWIFRIARHTVIDAYRSQRFFDEVSDELPDPDALNRADDQARKNDLLRTVHAALDGLPRRYREVLLLSFVAELSHAEVARVMRTSEGSVRILKFRALRKFEQLLPPEFRNHA